jgi:hypothetical protein
MNSTLNTISVDELLIRKDNLMKQILRIDDEIISRLRNNIEPTKKKISIKNKEDEVKTINATINTMKAVLDEHKIQYSSNCLKEELILIVRKNCLVRECENYEKNKIKS